MSGDPGACRSAATEPHSVLIICTGNSCRSQMAEAIWRELGRGEWRTASAGSRPVGYVHPLALRALARDGLALPDARSKALDEFAGQMFDRVVTVCDSAARACPHFPGKQIHHWPFDDPANATGTDADKLASFELVRDQIRSRVGDALDLEPGSVLRTWLAGVLERSDALATIDAPRRERFAALFGWTARVLDGPDRAQIWRQIPAQIASRFGDAGWSWNGFYQRCDAHLQLRYAAGPPVCATIDGDGATIGSAGMCYDAILTGQLVASRDVASYPGYVSCDGESGLTTVSGIACPIRTRGGEIVAVWDLDTMAPIELIDVVLIERYFATLSRLSPYSFNASLVHQ